MDEVNIKSVTIKYIKNDREVSFRVDKLNDEESDLHVLTHDDSDRFDKIYRIKETSLKNRINVVISKRMIIMKDVEPKLARFIWIQLFKMGFRKK